MPHQVLTAVSEDSLASKQPLIVHIAELPHGDHLQFQDTAFFIHKRGSFPAPEEVRSKNIHLNGNRAWGSRPPPVPFPELGLIVKFGSEITIAEGQCLWYLNSYLKDSVPTPEVFGWLQDGNEVFIYMELIKGDTLKERWPLLNEEEKGTICTQIGGCMEAWKELRQEKEPYFIGHVGNQGVGDIIFRDCGDPHVGPFLDITAFHDFFARYSCRSRPERNPRRDFPELVGLTDERPVVFTHADLDKSNILISPSEEGSPPRIIAIIDWHQSGWYPSGWEWMKAQGMCDPIEGGFRDTAWLEQFMAPADEDYAYAWEYITHSCM
ncbi:hypothetical protein BT63DRAFT_419466 [Microthyrium microscopicum]|uniref:Aminoglycoside phosphotransferase domain-containing protein n=1 Tax=Microthyrium microscopicum TaxID=703497 RepID=A0A6A6UPF1_9PEZI|nr:hypothetical protein BT63DRAFT_419466 [Microthyrium microscopicum]